MLTLQLLSGPHFIWTRPILLPAHCDASADSWLCSPTSFCCYSRQCFLAVLVSLLIQPFSAWAWSRSRYRGRHKRGREEPAHSSVGGWSSSHTLQDWNQAAPLLPVVLCEHTHTGCFPVKLLFLKWSHCIIIVIFFQGNRDESYEVDEELAEQDATSLFEVTRLNQIYYLTTMAEFFILNSINMCRRPARVASGQMSPLSATSWPPEITCSFRLHSRYMSRWGTAVIFDL